jgi:flavin-binding protein dodecin
LPEGAVAAGQTPGLAHPRPWAPHAGARIPAYHGSSSRSDALAGHQKPIGEMNMAKKSVGEGVYRVTEVIGSSTVSWEDAAKNAVTVASKSLRDLRIAEIVKLDMKVEGGKVVAYRARIQLSFKYEP